MTPSADDWLAVCRRATAGLRDVLDRVPTTDQRAVEVGRGEGGDNSLVIDTAAEDVIFAELDALHARGDRFVAVSEERGEVDYGDPGVRVVIDPIDGSLNAKRTLPAYSMSFAVASGGTMADVDVGYVYDFGNGEEWSAVRGRGATLNGVPLNPALPERRGADGRVEVLGIESADPRWVAEVAGDLVPLAYRLRALGSIAITLCQVAAARLDAMASLKRARAVDAAAGQLIAREAGALYAPLDMELDVRPRAPIMAARSQETLDALAAVLS
ncbi:MAG TPA: inositol monophosphatase family protein [Solirubrobacteraceae bacterium]|jgi:myo-inositol-1(or 4)-monophosphatase|nr:inositol monophosphatase family protein [Solirubrobacteraceae bacterium]